jgi:hypothetical protein
MNRSRVKYWDWKDWLLGIIVALLTIGAVIAVSWLIYAAFFERHTYRATVVDRWWTSSTRVTYTTSRLVTSSSLVCTGSGENRVCRTEISVHTETDTHTRCRKTSTGRDLPIIYPAATCKKRGDSVRRYVNYWVEYRPQEAEEVKQAGFSEKQWGILEPDTWVTITVNGLGGLVSVTE